MEKFESAAKAVPDRRLLLRGVIVLVVAVLLAVGAIAKSEGAFAGRVNVVALLNNVGDGLPTGSDVKFRGALVGTVDGVTPAIDGRPNEVKLTLDPKFAHRIPTSVTARVVPSNAFAVSSVQLVDNGPAPGLSTGDEIWQDDSLATVQFQTALTKLRDILSAIGKPGSPDAVGILAVVAEATDGRGDELTAAGSGARRIVDELNAQIAEDGRPSSLDSLSNALQGLQDSSPDLLEAVHNAVVPMRTLAEKRQELVNFLSAGNTTFGTMATAWENNMDRIIVMTTQLSPVLGVIADGGRDFGTIVTRINDVRDRFFAHVWNEDRGMATGKFMLVFTPNKMYTRQDCPRYGTLEGPSCQNAPLSEFPPVMPAVMDPANYQPPASIPGGNVGIIASPQERAEMAELLGPDPSTASEILLGPIARGNTVTIAPDAGPLFPAEAVPNAGPPLPAEAVPPVAPIAPGGTP